MTTDDQDKAIQALMTKQGYVTARVGNPLRGIVLLRCTDLDGNECHHTVGPDGYVPFYGYPAHEDVTP
jgi:hypothetical protein